MNLNLEPFRRSHTTTKTLWCRIRLQPNPRISARLHLQRDLRLVKAGRELTPAAGPESPEPIPAHLQDAPVTQVNDHHRTEKQKPVTKLHCCSYQSRRAAAYRADHFCFVSQVKGFVL